MSDRNLQAPQRKSLSPMGLAWRNLRKHRLAVWAGRALIVMYAAMLLDGFVAPYHYNDQSREHSYAPAGRLHWVDAEGRFHWRPFVYELQYDFDEDYNRVWYENTDKRYPLKFFIKREVDADQGRNHPTIFFVIPTERHLFGVEAPGRLYLLGADMHGRDVLSRMIYAGRVSLTIGLVGTAISLVLGMLVGGTSGYVGGWVDYGLQRLCELIMLIPGLYTLMILFNALPDDWSSVQVYFGVVVILSLIGWAGMGRIIRNMVLSVRESDYVLAARASGAPTWKIVTRHVLPQTFSYAIVAASLRIPAYILGESALSMIGMGIQDPTPSWGNMLEDARNISELNHHPWLLWPGVAIFVTVMAFNFLGDGVRDAVDPRSIGVNAKA
jgi:peptide/nickel transport system permease protein